VDEELARALDEAADAVEEMLWGIIRSSARTSVLPVPAVTLWYVCGRCGHVYFDADTLPQKISEWKRAIAEFVQRSVYPQMKCPECGTFMGIPVALAVVVDSTSEITVFLDTATGRRRAGVAHMSGRPPGRELRGIDSAPPGVVEIFENAVPRMCELLRKLANAFDKYEKRASYYL